MSQILQDNPERLAKVIDGVNEATRARRANEALYQLGLTYHEGLPIDQIGSILSENGFDTESLEGIYCGDSGRASDPVSAKRYLCLTWYRMPSRRFEIVAYVS